MRRRVNIADERGTTMVEVLVATATGLVVLSALTTVIVITLHGSARVSARVDATQRARVVVSRIMEELHSACVAPKIAPVQVASSGTTLRFIRAAGSEGTKVAPSPTLTVISLSGGVLTQNDYPSTGGTSPSWTFSPTPTTTQLATDVGPVAPSSSIFSYHAYSEGTVSETPLSTPLDGTRAATAVEVRVALTATPSSTPVADSGAPASVQSSAVLRLTPPSFNEKAVSLPCQ